MYILQIILYVGLLNLTLATHYRLPKVAQPKSYKLKIITHLNETRADEEFHFDGLVYIRLKIIANTQNITLHSKNLNIDETKTKLTSVDDEDTSICISDTKTDKKNEFYIVSLCNPIRHDEDYYLTIAFKGTLSTSLQGYYRTSYIDHKSNETRWLAVTNFEPAWARTAFPCFDEPEYKAKFKIQIGHHENYTALSNMPLITTKKLAKYDDWVWSIFEESYAMSTYLVSFIVHDYTSIKGNVTSRRNLPFQTYARSEVLQQCKYASNVGPKLLEYYEKTFDVDYPLPKIDLIAVPNMFGVAMENWGLLTFQEVALFYTDQHSSQKQKEEVTYIMAHELAHQWFGNLVTLDWWSDLWLNEGFASYAAALGANEVIPHAQIYITKLIEDLLRIFQIDALWISRPISQPIHNANEILDKFDDISYKKGSVLIRMVHMILGDEAFFKGINTYLNTYKYSNANNNDLWTAFASSSTNIKRIMDSWTLKAGYPVITVTRDYVQHSITITQNKYQLKTTSSSGITDNTCWWVPLTYTTQTDLNFNQTSPINWLECDSSNKKVVKTINLNRNETGWLIFNLQLSGLYKVNYDEQNWNLLIQTLLSDNFTKIHPINRAQLVEDALSLAWTGHVNYDVALRLIEYLKRERAYIPWNVALNRLNDVVKIIQPTSQNGLLRKYIRAIFTPIYKHLNGLKVTSDDAKYDYTIVQLKWNIAKWACNFDIHDCIAVAQEYFINWQKTSNPDKTNPIPTDLRSVVYCTAVRHGGENEWQFLWERYQNTSIEGERLTLLEALGCSREVWILQRFLEWSFDNSSNLNQQHALYAFDAIVTNNVGFHLAKHYFIRHFDELFNLYQSEIITLFQSLTNAMTSFSDFEEIEDLVDDNKSELLVVHEQVKQSIEELKLRYQWKEKHYKQFSFYLQQLSLK